MQAELGGAGQTAVVLEPLTAGAWREVIIPLSALSVANKSNMDGIWIQDAGGSSWPTFYLDDVKLIAGPSVGLTTPEPGASFTAPAVIELTASVTANGHTVNRVDFLANGTLLGSASAAPYNWTWTNVSAGTFVLIARLVYDGSATSDSDSVTVVVATTSSATILVDAQRNRHAINPLIYGVAFASSNELADLNAPLNRSGGNAETRYNWQLNAHNRGADWYFESIADTPGDSGGGGRRFRGQHEAGTSSGDADGADDRLGA